jgi:DNA adenine methylase
MGEAGAGDFVYMDPPYVPLPADEEGGDKKSFVGYNADGFAPSDHDRFFLGCEKLTAKKVDWLMSNSDVPDVRNRFPEGSYETSIVVCRRSINAKEPGSRVNEVLIRSFAAAAAAAAKV